MEGEGSQERSQSRIWRGSVYGFQPGRTVRMRQSVSTPLRVDQASHLLQPRYSGPHHEIDGRLAAEKEIVIRLRNPAVRQFVGKKDVQDLINSDEVGDPS